jgi:hypothetical protein
MLLSQVPMWATFRNRLACITLAGENGVQLERAPASKFGNILRRT